MIKALIRFPLAVLVIPAFAIVMGLTVCAVCLVSGWKALLGE